MPLAVADSPCLWMKQRPAQILSAAGAEMEKGALIQLMGFEAGLLEGEVTSERQLKTKALWGAWNTFGRFSAVLFDIRT